VVKAFPGDQVSLVSWSDDKRKLVVQVDSPTMGPAYALVDLDAKSARYLAEVYKDLTPEGVSRSSRSSTRPPTAWRSPAT
jgi:dipeptidyl aminopeptidase/acylaminoacyl peptidase